MSTSLTTNNSTGMVLAFTPEQKQLIKNTVAKGASDDELALFLHLSQTYGLDPFAKEIFFMKYGNQAATIITGRDGYLKIANGRPEMDGIQSDSVCKNDALTKKSDGTIDHTYGTPERGPVIGAYALVFRKDRSRAAYFYAPMAEYNASSNPTWKKYPTAMIIKVAEACALKRAFSISGLVTQEEMDVSQEGTRQVVQAQQEAQATYAEVQEDECSVLEAITCLSQTTTLPELKAEFLHFKQFHKTPEFVAAKDTQKLKLETITA